MYSAVNTISYAGLVGLLTKSTLTIQGIKMPFHLDPQIISLQSNVLFISVSICQERGGSIPGSNTAKEVFFYIWLPADTGPYSLILHILPQEKNVFLKECNLQDVVCSYTAYFLVRNSSFTCSLSFTSVLTIAQSHYRTISLTII